MIPLKLQLKNFLSYGSDMQTIDFEPYSLICLSGKNGHGKSALLDAITWALWGHARKISGTFKSDDALLRIGQTQMAVIFDFICNGQTYRIRREYMKTYGKPYVTVDFGLLDQKKDNYIPLNDKTIRTTQAKIEQTVHLDFDSFINSAFLRQGQANEFSKKSPRERKEILAAILGLDSYETLRKLATEKVRQAQAEKIGLDRFQEKMNQELQSTYDVPDNITTIEKQLGIILQKEQQAVEKRVLLDNEHSRFIEDKQQYQLISFQLTQIKNEEKKELEALRLIRSEWKCIHTKQLHLPNRSDLEQERKELNKTINEYQHKLQKGLELKEKYLEYKEELQKLTYELQQEAHDSIHQQTLHVERITMEKQHYQKEILHLSSTHKETEQIIESIKKECKELASTLHLSVEPREITTLTKQFEKRKEYYQRFVMQGSLIKEELNNLERKQKLSQDDSNPSCPLCEQNLSASRRRFLKQKFIKEERFLKHRLNRLCKIVKKLKDLLANQHIHINELSKVAEQQRLAQLQQEELYKKDNELTKSLYSINEKIISLQMTIEKRNSELTEEQKCLDERKKHCAASVENNESSQKTKHELNILRQRLRSLTYQPKQHAQAKKQLQAIEEQLNTYHYDLEQIALQDKRKQEINTLCTTLRQYKQKKEKLSLKIAQFADLEERQQKELANEHELAIHLDELKQQKETLLQEKGRLEQQRAKHHQTEAEIKKNKNRIDALTQSIEDYQTIAIATGKDGIQALLIQDIIPEIEQEANLLLAKLTDNQAQIFIESIRDLKKGGTKETLDIKISDAIGIRPYELFSGGEAFRIDFALRIAISKLLARRTGTSLQTLIIDEGFGSQDEEGLAHIMDAIYKVQEDFAKVIIVSHLSSMKDLFPVHFFIEKDPQGSRITVLERE